MDDKKNDKNILDENAVVLSVGGGGRGGIAFLYRNGVSFMRKISVKGGNVHVGSATCVRNGRHNNMFYFLSGKHFRKNNKIYTEV